MSSTYQFPHLGSERRSLIFYLNIMDGYIKIYRSMTEWEWHDDPNTGWLFIMLLLLANHEDVNWHGKVIRRGQLVTSLQKLSELTGISIQSLRTGLGRLQETGEITSEPTNKYRIITICKYDDYQGEKIEANKQLTNNQQTTNNQLTTNKNDKNNIILSSSSSTRVKVDDISEWMRGQKGTSQMESVVREIYRLTGTVPDGDTMASLIQRWIDELKIQGIGEKEDTDICQHFVSWARIAIPADGGRKKNTSKTIKPNNDERYIIKLPDEFEPLM